MRKKTSFKVSISYPISGLLHAVRVERNIKIHLIAALLAVITGVLLKIPLSSLGLIILTIGFVISMELINSAIERMVDLASPDLDPIAKLGKDLSAAAVLVSAIVSIIIGLITLGKPVLDWISLRI